MNQLTLKFHQSLRLKGIEHEFIESFDDVTILEAIRRILEPYPQMKPLCLQEGKKKPGILYLSGKTELASLGLLEHQLKEDLIIRIVPVLHGG